MFRSCLTAVRLLTVVVMVAGLGAVLQPAQAAEPENQGIQAGNNAQRAEAMDSARIDQFIAGMSDEQVRRLLIKELKAKALTEIETGAADRPGGFAGLVEWSRHLILSFNQRIAHLRSGTAAQADIPQLFSYLGMGERQGKSIYLVIFAVAAVLMGGLLAEWLFTLFTRSARVRLETIRPTGWSSKLSALALRMLIDLAALAVFVVVALVLFSLLLDHTTGQRILLAAYLLAIMVFQTIYIIMRFILAPRVPALRLLPLSDTTAAYLLHWLAALAFVYCFGMVTAAIIRLAGASELAHLQAVTLVGFVMAVILTAMVLGRREAVAAALGKGVAPGSLRSRMVQRWHRFAIVGIGMLYIASVFNTIMGAARGRAILTLLIIPLYFLLDWLLQLAIQTAFGVIERSEPTPVSPQSTDAGAFAVAGDDSDSKTGGTAPDRATAPLGLDLSRMQQGVRTGLRLALAALLFFWALRIWNIRFTVGEAVARAAFNILVVVLICYIVWCLANAAIQRRLQRETSRSGNDESEPEEGAAGGSRMATILVLLRKFMLATLVVLATLVALSSLGINIAPLIAGAGIVGLAIGFGAQTLVKDIIGGMFFLIDDAFRVGDYVECGGTKGMVEQISVRSLRIRHPRGMVHFIPFGDISTVTNFSRDYIITKLDFRVRFDTDVEKIRKIVKKKVSRAIEEDPELGPKLMGKIKSQGVRELDDSAMIIRVKYKTRPGDQFAIRREVYRLTQESFREAGIDFAHRDVTVHVPLEMQQAMANADDETRKKILQSGAAGAMGAIQTEK